MASFYANPNDENQPWIEKAVDGSGFRVWHMMFFCFSTILVVVILICCCIKIRIPRTKQEIEADYQRKKLARKFREKLKCIENQTVNGIDLKKALELIQQEIENEYNAKRNVDLMSPNKLSKESIMEGCSKKDSKRSTTLSDKLAAIVISKRNNNSQSYV